ncbi:MAG: THUMP domain-containing protein [Nitrosopumilaceae archaeon]|nr:THUMP domain-containing protein [Nitrosopumilaceae archaeon]
MNLIITCARHLEPETQSEFTQILKEMGDSEPIVNPTSMSGIITAQTKLDPIQIVNDLREQVLDEPWSLRYSLRVIPVQKETQTKIEKIEEVVDDLSNLISGGETYRISVERRNSNISSQEIISRIARRFPNKVSLENPDKVIQIEILGDKTGIAIIKNSDILSVEKTKRSLSD